MPACCGSSRGSGVFFERPSAGLYPSLLVTASGAGDHQGGRGASPARLPARPSARPFTGAGGCKPPASTLRFLTTARERRYSPDQFKWRIIYKVGDVGACAHVGFSPSAPTENYEPFAHREICRRCYYAPLPRQYRGACGVRLPRYPDKALWLRCIGLIRPCPGLGGEKVPFR